MEQISLTSGRKSLSSLAIRVGFVVTPFRTPQRAPSRISSRFDVSRNSFTRCFPLFFLTSAFALLFGVPLRSSVRPLGLADRFDGTLEELLVAGRLDRHATFRGFEGLLDHVIDDLGESRIEIVVGDDRNTA